MFNLSFLSSRKQLWKLKCLTVRLSEMIKFLKVPKGTNRFMKIPARSWTFLIFLALKILQDIKPSSSQEPSQCLYIVLCLYTLLREAIHRMMRPLIWRNLIKRLYWGCYSLLALCFDHYSGPLASQPLLWGSLVTGHTNPITGELLTLGPVSRAEQGASHVSASPTFILPSILNIDWWRPLTVTHNITNNSLI